MSRKRRNLWMLVLAATLGMSGCGIPSDTSGTTSLLGDANLDGVINQADLDLLTAAFGSSENDPSYLPEADLSGDGRIGLDDLQALIQLLDAQAA